MDNRREFSRIVRKLEVDIDGERRIAGTTHNLSMNGLFVVAESSLGGGAAVRCTLYVDGRDGAVQVRGSGTVVRSTSEGMAIKFHELEGLESFEHLQRLLLLNAGSQTEQVEREFARHLGLKPR